MDWQAFKKKQFAVKCTTDKERFFADCASNGIYNFMSEGAMKRNLFICRLCYQDAFSDGRYELMSVDEWQVKENGLYGNDELEIVDYNK